MTLKFRRTCPPHRLDAALAAAERDEVGGLAQIQDLLRSYPADPRLHYATGTLLASGRRYEEAMAAMARALELEPRFKPARFQLGLLAMSLGDRRRAHSVLAPLLALSFDDPLHHLAQGLEHLAADRLDEAAECFRFGVALNWPGAEISPDVQALLAQVALMRLAAEGEKNSAATSAGAFPAPASQTVH